MPNVTLPWKHQQPVRIISEENAVARLPGLVKGGHILFVTSKGFTDRGLTQSIARSLKTEQVVSIFDDVTPNPELSQLTALVRKYKTLKVTSIIALGGGSVLDTGKILAAMLSEDNKHSLSFHLTNHEEIVALKPLQLIAVPTTSGTGAEVTPFATIWCNKTNKKQSLTGDFMYPEIALLSPELTLSLPKYETLFTGLDALSHSLESLWNKNKNPISIIYAEESIKLLHENFETVLTQPHNLEARQKMQTASLLAGLAISDTKTAIAHAISYPLTSHFKVPHGVACSFTLHAIIELVQENYLLKNHDQSLSLAKEILSRLPLNDLITNYADQKQIIQLSEQMNDSTRSGNFIFEATSDNIKDILTRSTSKGFYE